MKGTKQTASPHDDHQHALARRTAVPISANKEPTVTGTGVLEEAGTRPSLRPLSWTGMTQEEFAAALGIPVATLRNWEQGRNAIDPAARSLLILVARDPEGTLAALAAARSAGAPRRKFPDAVRGRE